VLELAAWGHPAFATFALGFAFFVFRDGFAQRKLRLRREPAPEGSRARHVRLAPLSVLVLVGSMVGGLASAVFLRGWSPLATFHGKLGLLSALAFAALWWLGRRLEAGKREEANRHGVLGVLALFAAGVTGLLGISLLP
jgi:hypothetical protein